MSTDEQSIRHYGNWQTQTSSSCPVTEHNLIRSFWSKWMQRFIEGPSPCRAVQVAPWLWQTSSQDQPAGMGLKTAAQVRGCSAQTVSRKDPVPRNGSQAGAGGAETGAAVGIAVVGTPVAGAPVGTSVGASVVGAAVTGAVEHGEHTQTSSSSPATGWPTVSSHCSRRSLAK